MAKASVSVAEGGVKVEARPDTIDGYYITQYSMDQREPDSHLFFKDRASLEAFIALINKVLFIEDQL